MLSRRRNRKPSFLILLPIHNSGQRVVFSGAVGFVPQQPLDLITVLPQEGAIEMDISARRAIAHALAGGAYDQYSGAEFRMLRAQSLLIRLRPAAVGVFIATYFAHRRFRWRAARAMAAGFIVHTFCVALVCVSLLIAHKLSFLSSLRSSCGAIANPATAFPESTPRPD